MHDWTLIGISVDWLKGEITVLFKDANSSEKTLVGQNFSSLNIPKKDDWGKSVSVNEVDGPRLLKNGDSFISIEIQSGDCIELYAETILLPDCN